MVRRAEGSFGNKRIIFIKISCNAGDNSTMLLRGAILNQTEFQKAYDKLSAETMDITAFSNTRVDGTVTSKTGGLLYTSIPQNGNWKVYVDGKETDVTLIAEGMTGVMLEAGTHEISFRYQNSAFIWGIVVSLMSATALGGLYWLSRKPKFKGKYEKQKK